MRILRDEGSHAVLYDTTNLKFEVLDQKPWPDHDSYRLGIPRRQGSLVPSAPIRIYWEITRHCNLKCKHCFVTSSPKLSMGKSTEELMRMLHEMHKIGVIDLRLTGGEVTTRPDWVDLLREAKQLGFVLSLNTNGVYQDPDKTIDDLKQLGLDQVTVSLDGLKDAHDSNRGDGMFEKTFAALCTMKAAGIRTRVNCVLTSINQKDALLLLDQCKPLVEEINFFWMRPVGRGRKLLNQMIDFETYQSSADQILNVQSITDVRIMHREKAIAEQAIRNSGNSCIDRQKIVKSLPAGFTTMSISAEGGYWIHGYNMYQDKRLCFGRFPDDLESAWHDAPVLAKLRKWQDDLLARCSGCEIFGVTCPGDNLEMEVAVQLGVLDQNPYCTNNSAVPRLELL
jgi:MoaA/NifB/PqqE/SkfB family radical SAM enzyme